MSEVVYPLKGNAVFNFYVAEENYHDRYVNERTIASIHKFKVEKIERISSNTVKVYGSLTMLITINKSAKPFVSQISIPILFDDYDQFGNKQPLVVGYFEKELNAFKDGIEEVDSSHTIVSGKKADSLWENYVTYTEKIKPNDAKEYPDLPESLRMDLELTLKKYHNNKAFKERYDNFFERFFLLATDLVREHPDEVAMVIYKGMPIIYLTDEESFQYGVLTRLYMTPISMYTGSLNGYTSKLYDISKEKIFYGLDRMTKISKNYILCPARLQDLFYILHNIDSRFKVEPKPEEPKKAKKFFGMKIPKLF